MNRFHPLQLAGGGKVRNVIDAANRFKRRGEPSPLHQAAEVTDMNRWVPPDERAEHITMMGDESSSTRESMPEFDAWLRQKQEEMLTREATQQVSTADQQLQSIISDTFGGEEVTDFQAVELDDEQGRFAIRALIGPDGNEFEGTIDLREPDSLEWEEFDDWPPRRGMSKGGDVRKKERPKMDLLRAVGESLAGAVPFKGNDPEFVKAGGDIPALLATGFKSQWWGTNPTTGEYEYAGPGADAIHGRSRPSYPSDELMRIDPAAYREQYEAWRDWEDPGLTGPIPGIIDETAALPLLAGMFGAPVPEFAEEAGKRTEDNWQRAFESQGLEEPQGFAENTLASLGLMAGQLPVPSAWLRRVKPAAKGALNRLGRIGGAVPRAGIEFLSPIVEPKVANYVAGALFGGTLMTVLEPGEVPPDIQELLERAEGGDREAYEQLKALHEEYEQGESDKAALREYGQSDAFRDSMDLLPQGGPYAKGGKVKSLTRRDVLKGLLGAGATVAAGSKAARHTGMDEVGDALRRLDEGISTKAVPTAKSVAERLADSPTATFNPTNLSEPLTNRLKKILGDYFDSQDGLTQSEIKELYPLDEQSSLDYILSDLNEGYGTNLSKENMEHLESVLEEAVDDLRLAGSSDQEVGEATELLGRLRNAPALDLENFFENFAEDSWDKPSAVFEYADRKGIPPEKVREIPMKGLEDPEDIKFLSELFGGEENIPAALWGDGWDT